MMRVCAVDGCTGRYLAKGYCAKHYARVRKHGSPSISNKADVGEPQRWIIQHKHYSGNDCLDWPFAKVPLGYGYCIWNGKLSRVARIMCEINYGRPETDRHEAAHNCGNAHCVNPRHLRWATPESNQADRIKHGTHNRGEMRSFAKLSDFDVLAIRGSKGLPASWLAKKYGVRADHITRLQRADRWSWL